VDAEKLALLGSSVLPSMSVPQRVAPPGQS